MEMIKDMWSVIVPVYKVEKYLEECVDSILAQDYRPMEIILIDDGSPDRSGEMCDRYAEKYPDRVRVIHKENGGASTARNAGIDAARGEFIGFIDSDDKILPGMGTNTIAVMKSTGAGVVCTRYVPFGGRTKLPPILPHPMTVSGIEALRMACDGMTDFSVNTKVYRRSAIGDLRFPSGVTNEDFLFNSRVFIDTPIIHFTVEGYDCYRITPGSVTYTFKDTFFDMFTNIEVTEKIIPEDATELRKSFDRYRLRAHITSGVRIVQNRKNRQYKKWLRRNRRYILGHLGTLLFSKRLKKREWLKAGFAFLHLPFRIGVRQ